jgi:hypothetical protein
VFAPIPSARETKAIAVSAFCLKSIRRPYLKSCSSVCMSISNCQLPISNFGLRISNFVFTDLGWSGKLINSRTFQIRNPKSAIRNSYSYLSATIGSTLLARQAGIRHASNAAASSTPATAPKARVSIAPTPYKVDCIARPTR